MTTFAVLLNSMGRLGAGDYSVRTGVRSQKGEFGRLSRAFDQMVKNLERCETERKITEKALRASEMRYRGLFESARDGILILDARTGQIIDANPFLIGMLGYSRKQLLGNQLWETGPFKDIEGSKATFAQLEHEPCVYYEDVPLKKRDGELIHVEFVSNVYLVEDEKVIQCNIRDITKRKLAEKERNEYSRRLQVLSRRLVETQEAERRHLARDLHDEIGQALTIAQLNLRFILNQPVSVTLKPRLTQSLMVVERVLQQVRDISLNLRPSMLDDLGLLPALRWYTKRQAALAGLRWKIRADPLVHRFDPVIETECFRVAQEALTNVARHARAHNVAVELRNKEGQLHLRVRDDGIGFDVTEVLEKAVLGESLGLLSMNERAALAGGRVELKSAPGRGAEVHAWFPLKWQASPS